MKKILLSSVVLTTFAISIIIFQLSCKKTAEAQATSNYILPPATTTTLGGIIIGDGLSITNNGTLSVTGRNTSSASTLIFYVKSDSDDIWKANIDGTGQTKLNIIMPSGYEVSAGGDGGQIQITSDGNKILFKGRNNNSSALFSCNLDGTNVTKLIDNLGTSFTSN